MKNKFEIWKTIKLGTNKAAEEFHKIRDISSSGVLERVLRNPKFTIASEEKEVKLVNVSVIDLGFPNGADNEDIWAKAKELGLELCPSEVGPQLHLQNKDQPKGELYIAMEPIYDYASYLGISNRGWIIFLLRCGGAPHLPFLDFSCCYNSFREGNARFVFVSKD